MMKSFIKEILFTTDSKDGIVAWDTKTGNIIMNYKDGIPAEKTVTLLQNKWLLACQDSKPILNLWNLGRKEKVRFHSVCPGVIQCMLVLECYNICIMAFNEKIYLWHLFTGNLLAVIKRHYQTVSFLKSVNNGMMFISAGKDGLIMAWNLPDILNVCIQDQECKNEPFHLWSQHSLPITGLHVGFGNSQARLCSCSLDQTCKLFDITSGQLLVSLLLFLSPSCLTMDNAEFKIFIGTAKGGILSISTFSEGGSLQVGSDVNNPNLIKNEFIGHSLSVDFLQVTLDGATLFSASKDCTVHMWCVSSCQCLRTFTLKAPITSMFVEYLPFSVFHDENKIKNIPIHRFQLQNTVGLNLEPELYLPDWGSHLERNRQLTFPYIYTKHSDANQEELQKLKRANKQLYMYIINNLLDKNST